MVEDTAEAKPYMLSSSRLRFVSAREKRTVFRKVFLICDSPTFREKVLFEPSFNLVEVQCGGSHHQNDAKGHEAIDDVQQRHLTGKVDQNINKNMVQTNMFRCLPWPGEQLHNLGTHFLRKGEQRVRTAS